MSDIRLKDKVEVGRDLNDNDLIFITKTNEDTDNPSTFGRIKNQIVSNTTALTETFYSKTGHTHTYSQISDINDLVNTKANISGQTFSGNIYAPSVSASTLSAATIYSANTNIESIFAAQSQVSLLSAQVETKANVSGQTFSGNIYAPAMSASTLSAATIIGDIKYDVVYLTYYGTSGTTSATSANFGATLTAPGEWTITKFNTSYFLDDTDGNLIITIPDSNNLNKGKTMFITKPRLVKSQNFVLIKTLSNQEIAESSTFYLKSPNDRVELISTPFSNSGSSIYKYRVNMIDRSIHESIEISVGGTQLFSDIKSAVDYCNMYADGPRRIKINPGEYYITETIEVNCPFPIVIDGFGTEITHINATTGLTLTPMFDLKTKCDFKGITFSGTNGYGLVDDECCLDCGVENIYFEVHQCVIDGFYKGIEIEGNSEYWVFDSIIQNCQTGLYCVGGSLGASELTLLNNNNGFYLSSTTTGNSFSIQNTVFQVNENQIGINYIPNQIIPDYFFVNSNTFIGNGTFISGLTFTTKTQADFAFQANANLPDYNPFHWTFIQNNTSTTTLTNTNQYYLVNFNVASIIETNSYKFSGGVTTTEITYMPSVSRNVQITISGDLSLNTTNQTISFGIFKNFTKISDIDVRVVSSTTPYPFAIVTDVELNENDSIQLGVANLTSSGRLLTLRTLHLIIK